MPKNLGIEEMKKIEFDMLKEIKHICKKLNITYYLCGGTLLGAVRHEGFIPWDDDIDILFMREDYEKLEKYFKENNNQIKHYKLLSLNLVDDYYYPMMKLVDTDTFMKEEDTKEIKDLGVYLDIFPIDGYPNNKLIGKLHLKKLSFLKKSHYMAYTSTFSTSHKLLKPIKYLWFKCSSKIGARKLAFKTEKIAKKYKRSNCLIWANTSIGDPKELMPKAVFERIDNYKFNNENFTSMKNYDYYLTSMYGDYMKLPPKNQQVTHHHYIAYYKDSEDI